jgi:hypothetical protein
VEVKLKMMKRGGANLVIVGLLLPCFLCFGQTDDTTSMSTPETEAYEVVSSGLGAILGSDVAHARDDAIEDALKRGLEDALGLFVKSETLVENYQLIEDNIYSKTQGYVQKYDVISEGKRNEELYEVTVRATIKMAELKDDYEAIKTLMRRKNMPRIMMMIEESNIGEAPGLFHYVEADMNTAEISLTDALMEKGFKFIDRATVKKNLDKEKAAAILEGDVNQAASLGKTVGAEIVLTGKAFAKATVIEAFGVKQRSQQATVTVKAIRTDTGDIIATSSGQGAYPHIDDVVGGTKAIQKACRKMSDDLITKILDRWQADISSGATLTLKVKGVKDYTQLNRFKFSLKYYVRDLQTVTQRQWDEGYAILEVVMKGTSEDLAQRLSGKDISGSLVEVIGMSQNSVTVQLLKTE